MVLIGELLLEIAILAEICIKMPHPNPIWEFLDSPLDCALTNGREGIHLFGKGVGRKISSGGNGKAKIEKLHQ